MGVGDRSRRATKKFFGELRSDSYKNVPLWGAEVGQLQNYSSLGDRGRTATKMFVFGGPRSDSYKIVRLWVMGKRIIVSEKRWGDTSI